MESKTNEEFGLRFLGILRGLYTRRLRRKGPLLELDKEMKVFNLDVIPLADQRKHGYSSVKALGSISIHHQLKTIVRIPLTFQNPFLILSPV